jgi:hypothetical protein
VAVTCWDAVRIDIGAFTTPVAVIDFSET